MLETEAIVNAANSSLINSVTSIAFPCISTGNYGFPAKAAAEIAVKTVRGFIQADAQFTEVVFCCLSKGGFNLYQRLLNEPTI